MAKKLEISTNKIDNVRPGDPISAAGENVVRDTVRELARIQNPKSKKYHRIRLMRLTEVIGVQQSDDSDAWVDKSAVDRYYNLNTEEWSDGEGQYNNVTDAFDGLPADINDQIPCFYHEQSGKWIPLWARTVRHAITCRHDGTYPPEISVIEVPPGTGDSGSDIISRIPNVYPIKFVKIAYSETPTSHGYAAPVLSYLNPANTHDDFVFNIADQDGPYLPFGSLICCYHVAGQWFCAPGGEPTGDESSGSSQSHSGSSASTQQQSSSGGESSQQEGESSSGGENVCSIGGVELRNIPVGTPAEVQYFLAVNHAGCLMVVPKDAC